MVLAGIFFRALGGQGWKDRAPLFPTRVTVRAVLHSAPPVERFEFPDFFPLAEREQANWFLAGRFSAPWEARDKNQLFRKVE